MSSRRRGGELHPQPHPDRAAQGRHRAGDHGGDPGRRRDARRRRLRPLRDRARRRRAARSPRLFAGAASVALTAAIAAAAARAIEPFAHGIWLTAYLFLVGFLAQLLLGRGQAMVAAEGPADANPPPIGAQAVLWNAGVVAVPLGVLLGARVFVVLGSLALLASLVMFWQERRPRHAGSGFLEIGYAALIVFMAASVLVGTALAWDIPWF